MKSLPKARVNDLAPEAEVIKPAEQGDRERLG